MSGSSDLSGPYWGKYRGVVLENIDPMQRGRILAQVPAISSLLPTTWCEPCMPFAGPQAGVYVVPPPLSGVWIEFEQGDVAKPVWTGGFWGSLAEVPALALLSPPGDPNIVLQTLGQTTLLLSDLPGPTGGILLKTTTGASISISDTGIIIQNGLGAAINLVGPAISVTTADGAAIVLAGPTVSINGAALVVT